MKLETMGPQSENTNTNKKNIMNTKTQFVNWKTPGSETTVVMVNTKCSRTTKRAVRKLLQCIVGRVETRKCAVNNSLGGKHSLQRAKSAKKRNARVKTLP